MHWIRAEHAAHLPTSCQQVHHLELLFHLNSLNPHEFELRLDCEASYALTWNPQKGPNAAVTQATYPLFSGNVVASSACVHHIMLQMLQAYAGREIAWQPAYAVCILQYWKESIRDMVQGSPCVPCNAHTSMTSLLFSSWISPKKFDGYDLQQHN